MNESLSIAFIGNREHSVYVLDHLIAEGWEVSCVIGPDRSSARHQAGGRLLDRACEEQDVPYIDAGDINSERVVRALETARPDIGVCAGWTQIISDRVTAIPPYGFIGVHASRLPSGRGGAPVNWQLIAGASEVGLSVFELDPEVDHGAIYAQTTVPIEPRDDVATVYHRVTAGSCELIASTLASIATGTAAPRPQSFAEASYRPQRYPEDGIIDWTLQPPQQLDWIRALTDPYPGAFTFYDARRLVIWSASPSAQVPGDATPGEVIAVDSGTGVHVCTGEGAIMLDRVQAASHPPAWADVWAAATGIEPGAVLGAPAAFPPWLYTGIRGPDGGFAYETNLAPGERGTLLLRCIAHAAPTRVRYTVTQDAATLDVGAVTVTGRTDVPVSYGSTDHGSHTLRVAIEADDGERQPERTIKFYVA